MVLDVGDRRSNKKDRHSSPSRPTLTSSSSSSSPSLLQLSSTSTTFFAVFLPKKMAETIDQLANSLVQAYTHRSDKSRRFLIGVAGVPGSGKSTLAPSLTSKINEVLSSTGSTKRCIGIGMDGWHYTRQALSSFEDPEEALRRRGAHFTFDAPAYHQFIQSLRSPTHADQSIPFPTFSHSLKDPSPSERPIEPSDDLVLIEGLYVLLDIAPWSEAAALLDARIWIEANHALTRERLIRRHVETGVEQTTSAAQNRVDGSDMLNAEFIQNNLVKQDVTVVRVISDGFDEEGIERNVRFRVDDS